MDYRILLYVFFGILPSFAWLCYYLAKDKHPEPKRAILRIFLWGAVVTLPVVLIQLGGEQILNQLRLPSVLDTMLRWFVVISFTEELFKFLVVKLKAMRSRDLDEPLDIMLYMVVSALGFAALENILYLFNPHNALLPFDQLIETTAILSFVRFVGATFLHTLCSGIVGYFLALETASPQRKLFYTEMGLVVATVLHGIYDLLIMNARGYETLIALAVILLAVGFMTFAGFDRLRAMKSVSEVVAEK